jgi:hypothetical protein
MLVCIAATAPTRVLATSSGRVLATRVVALTAGSCGPYTPPPATAVDFLLAEAPTSPVATSVDFLLCNEIT